jgi:hypothetical protein
MGGVQVCAGFAKFSCAARCDCSRFWLVVASAAAAAVAGVGVVLTGSAFRHVGFCYGLCFVVCAAQW